MRELIAQEREAMLAALGEHSLDSLLELKGFRARRGAAGASISVVVGPFHVEHVFIEDSDAPFMRRSRVERQGEADLIEVETNLAFEQLSGDAAAWASHNIAEAIALELAAGDDYIDAKSRIWSAVHGQQGLLTALRRSALRRTPLAGESARA